MGMGLCFPIPVRIGVHRTLVIKWTQQGVTLHSFHPFISLRLIQAKAKPIFSEAFHLQLLVCVVDMKNQGTNNKDLDEVEDWCFVCKDGGALRSCDYQGCTKVYHSKCVNRKEDSFLKSEKRWTCDHHSCSLCSCRRSRVEISFSCLLCTYSVCEKCRKSRGESEFVVMRGKENVGLCGDCLELVRLVEENAEYDKDGDKLDFEDQDTFESRFKECWEILKEKEGLSLEDIFDERREILDEEETTLRELLIRRHNKRNEAAFDYEEEPEEVVSSNSYRNTEENGMSEDDDEETTLKDCALRNHRKRKLVISDSETSSDSGAKEPHFENGISEDDEDEITQNDLLPRRLHKKPKLVIPCYVKPSDSEQKEPHLENEIDEDVEDEDEITLNNRFVRKLHKKPRLVIPCYVQPFGSKENEEVMHPNPTRNAKESCFASIVASNMKLVYLRRSLVEKLMSEQPHKWERKVVGSYVRVENDPENYFHQVNSSHQLVQVRGITRKQEGGEILLHLLARDVPISLLSDDDFTEEECSDLREGVEMYLVRRPTVVEIEHKARQLHEDLIRDWSDREFIRLMTCIRPETNERGWIGKEVSKYMELREMMKQISEQGRLLEQVPQVTAEVLDRSEL